MSINTNWNDVRGIRQDTSGINTAGRMFDQAMGGFQNIVDDKTKADTQQALLKLNTAKDRNELSSLSQELSKGDFIGLSGKTGNASDESNPTPVTSHVHVEFRLFEDGISFNKSEAVNPEIFLATKFDTAGVPSNNPCN